MGIFSSEDPKMPVTAYYASVHYGVCQGPVDEVLEVWYGEKVLMDQPLGVSTSLLVAKGDLFGGEKVEGGFVGRLDFLFGGSNQTVSPALAEGLERNEASATSDPGKLPGYRGVFTMYIHG